MAFSLRVQDRENITSIFFIKMDGHWSSHFVFMGLMKEQKKNKIRTRGYFDK